MAYSLALKRFLSSSPLSRSLLHPVASSASRSSNTNAMRQYHEHTDDCNVDDDSHSDRASRSSNTNAMRQYHEHADDCNVDADSHSDCSSTSRRDNLDNLFSGVFNPLSPTRSLTDDTKKEEEKSDQEKKKEEESKSNQSSSSSAQNNTTHQPHPFDGLHTIDLS